MNHLSIKNLDLGSLALQAAAALHSTVIVVLSDCAALTKKRMMEEIHKFFARALKSRQIRSAAFLQRLNVLHDIPVYLFDCAFGIACSPGRWITFASVRTHLMCL